MQNDSVRLSTSGPTVKVGHQEVGQDPQVKSYRCTQCTLVFKAKVFLFEHLNKVHGFNVDDALLKSGLKHLMTSNTNADNKSRSSESNFKCQHCDFKSSSREVLNDHGKQCPRKTQIPNITPCSSFCDNLDMGKAAVRANGHSENAKAEDVPTSIRVVSSSHRRTAQSMSKDLKTYKRPPQTIIKYLVASSKSKTKSSAQLSDSSKGTTILQESPSSASSSRDGMFQATAKKMIDVSNSCPSAFLQNDPLLCDKLKQPKVKDNLKNPLCKSKGKRIRNEHSESSLPKKRKTGKEDETANASKQESPNRVEFSFEFSEDEGEKKGNIGNEDDAVFFCKQCDYSDKGVRRLSTHYKRNHPYVRFNLIYLKDSDDKSATFRCLECPVEFVGAAVLKRHYKKNHPEAPDVFTLKPSAFNLIHKCFLCPFDSISLKTLKDHYGKKHPAHKMGNSLLFCRYSVTGCQKEPSQSNPCEKTSRVEKSEESFPVTTGTPKDKNTTLPQPHTSKGANVTLYKCNSCSFSHKSVVVMHVHYQKSHPDEAMTIDKIKQSARLTSHLLSPMTPEKSANSPALMKTKGKAALSQSTNVLLSSKVFPESPKQSPFKSTRETTPDKASLSPSSPGQMLHCKFCNYTSTYLKGLIGHQNAKHYNVSTTTDEILQYSIGKEKTKTLKIAKTSESTPSSHSENSLQANSQDSVKDTSLTKYNAYEHAEKLFYCLECHYGNPNVKGIQTHQGAMHPGLCDSSPESIINYSTSVCETIKKSKSQPKEFPFSTGLPYPLLKEGDESMFFCHLCNYRNRKYDIVYKHYSKAHRGYQKKPGEIKLYSSIVHKQKERPDLKTAVDQEVNQNSLVEKKNAKKLPQTLSDSAQASLKTSQTQRNIRCYKCNYKTQYVFLLKSHIFRVHHTKQSIMEILKEGFKQGALQSGYYCELCVSNHTKPKTLYKHYQEHHPGRKLNFKYVSTRLYVGPLTSSHKKKEPESKSIDGSGDEGINKLESVAPPWPERKADLDHLYSRKGSAKSENRLKKDLNEIPQRLESWQVPFESDKLPDKAFATEFKCPYCSLVVSNQHNLAQHCRIKHPEAVTKSQKEVPAKSRVHVFKCPHCTYVNTIYQGVLTHCQKKHPNLPSRAESLHVDLTMVQSFIDNRSASGGSLEFKGHMCDTCSLIYVTQEKLLRHCETEHSEMKDSPTQSTLQATATKSSAAPTKLSLFKGHGHQTRVTSKVSFLKKKGYNSLKCQLCAQVCISQIALNRHLRVQHKDAFPEGHLFECELCPLAYFSKRHLDRHFALKHEKVKDLKNNNVLDQISQRLATRPHHDQNTSVACKSDPEENKIRVFKCPCCPYVNSSLHGILTHSQMKHPTVVVRAFDLQIDEILSTNMVGCQSGKASNQRGYTCETCPQIYATIAKLTKHYRRAHQVVVAFEHLVKSENGDVDISSRVKVSEANNTELDLGTNPSNPQSLQIKTKSYKCHLCSYSGLHRRYLYAHYRQTHKLDEHSILAALEKYSKLGNKKVELPSEPLKRVSDTCVKCPDLMFDSPELLVDHYSTFHLSDCKMDFVVISTGLSRGSTGLYRCSHCQKQLNGIRKLSFHMCHHRQRKKEEAKRQLLLLTPKQEPNFIQDESPMPQTDEQFNQPDLSAVESMVSLSSPVKSPSKVDSSEQPKTKSTETNHPCEQCGRTFMSLKGLGSHKRSHAAVAAIKNLSNLPQSALKTDITKYVTYKSGTMRPFRCTLCSYRSVVMGLCWSHFLKKHPGVLLGHPPTDENDVEDSQGFDIELPPSTSGQFNNWEESDESREEAKSYLEPQDVQRQINHYLSMVRVRAPKDRNVQQSNKDDPSLIYCDMCSFCTEHLSSMRRHYVNRHGKKSLKCKDCDFFTSSRKTLEMHMKTGHSTFQSGLPHQKALRCPFCLYQTKNKNMMIDHVVLHREERVIPIEVRRPKLSRYLQGIVFRCHECTFTCGSGENLQSHMTRHDAVRPYKCRLCFFDCTQLSDLEAHLSDKHQVVRNHELVGQVSLDQLETKVGRTSEMEEDPPSTSEPLSNDGVEAKAEATERNSVQDGQTEHVHHEQEPQRPDGSQNDDEEEGGNVQMEMEDCSWLQRERNDPGESSGHEDDDGSSTDEATKGDSHSTVTEQTPKNIEESFEDDILRNILLLDEDGSNCHIHKKTDPEGTVQNERKTVIESPRDGELKGEEGDVKMEQDPPLQPGENIHHTQDGSPKTVEQPVSPSPDCLQDASKQSFTACEGKQASENVPEASRGETPALQNERLDVKEEEASNHQEEEEKQSEEQESGEELKAECISPPPDEELFTCDLCGRNLDSSSELKRHVLRHGM